MNKQPLSLDRPWLARLGAGESVASLCRELGIEREEFMRRWEQTLAERTPRTTGERRTAVKGPVEIERDRWGIPHIYAENDDDLFFGFGYAMAQDRLFQLDYLRRKGLGRLAEVLGAEGLESDRVARTVGLNRIAAAEWQRLPREVQSVLESFSAGINAVIEHSEILPIEFDLLAYRPEPWAPLDSLAIENEFRWYLTGRFPIIVMPELAKRVLGDGTLYREFILGEADDEAILHRGEYQPRLADAAGLPTESVGHAIGDPEEGIGSNNWVLAGRRTTTGKPLLASDPHIAFGAVSCWYEAHLCGGSYNVAGAAYVGMPAILLGQTERVAWGITNNICSQRDLYQECASAEHPGCFLYDGQWEPAASLVETIRVRGGESVDKTIRFSRNGPVVDEILPEPARETGPVTLKWLGAHEGGWLTALLAMARAIDVDSFREALRPWHVPTFSLVFADDAGRIGYHAAGRIPVRNTHQRGYRAGWDPQQQWQGLIPFEQMPQLTDPPRGWIATANNRVAPDDYPYPLAGCWSTGWRALRIREWIEGHERLSAEDMVRMHQDAKSLRAAAIVSALAADLDARGEARWQPAIDLLRVWDHVLTIDSVPASIYSVFFAQWCRAVAQERFEPRIVELMIGGIAPCAGRLLAADPAGWFAPGKRQQRIAETFDAALDWLFVRLGPDIHEWRWGRLHRMPLEHVLGSRGDLGLLLNRGGAAVRGDYTTVCNTGSGPDYNAVSGAGYRLIADLSAQPPTLVAIDAQSQSGHPGSPHYADQFHDWAASRYHEIPLHREVATEFTVDSMRLVPAKTN